MPSITFDKFEVGLDRRKDISVADANRLYNLTNAYVTKGKVIRKRPGSVLDNTLEAGTTGLVSGLGKLNTFYESGAIVHANPNYMANKIPKSGSPVKFIHFGDVFLGFIYVVAEYYDGTFLHSYLDGTVPPAITDVNCPQTKQALKASSKIWSVGATNDTVRFCKSAAARDWTTASDAGFIPTGLQATGSADALALGKYSGFLTVGFNDAIQLWNISAIYSGITFFKPVDGIPCRFLQSIREFAGDQLFLSKSGFRSISQQVTGQAVLNIVDVDVGSPVDAIVKPYINDNIKPQAAPFISQGQYWCLIDTTTNVFFVFTVSRTVKVAAWSQYLYPYNVDVLTLHNGSLYLRSGNNVYAIDETDTIFSDNGDPYEMRAEFPFLNFKTPGIDKYISSMDITVNGSVNVQFRYDPNDITKITDPITVTGDGRSKEKIPVEITVPALAPIFTDNSTNVVQIDAFSFYYDNLGPQ